MCNTGVGLTPRIDGNIHHFSAGGLYNGLVLLIDDESRTYWDHISGRAVHGRLAGSQLEIWGIGMSSVQAALQDDPELLLHKSQQSFTGRIMSFAAKHNMLREKLPPGFRRTMGQADDRLREMEMGLGLIGSDVRKFYPLSAIRSGIEDEIDGKRVKITISAIDGIPSAVFDDGMRPLQLFTRWYGFSYTFTGCQIYEHSGSRIN